MAKPTTSTPKPAINLDQWADGTAPDLPVVSGSQADKWQNGNLGSSQAHYSEGEFVPYRTVLTNLKEGTTYYVTIQYDTTQSGLHALDYLGTYNTSFPAGRNETTVDPTTGVTGFLTNSSTTFAIPTDPKAEAGLDEILGTPDDITQVSGGFTLYGGVSNLQYVLPGPDGVFNTGDDVINPANPYTLSGSYGGNSSTSITLKFTYTGDGDGVLNEIGTAALAWGGHIATREDWGNGNSAVSISGSPYHMRLTGFVDTDPNTSESVGNQDRSLSSAAVTFPGSITVEKQTTPDNSGQSFNFELTRTANTVDVLSGGVLDLTGDGVIDGDDDGRFVDSDGDVFSVVDGAGITDINATGDGKLNGFTLVTGRVDVDGGGISSSDKFTNLTGTGVVTFSLSDGQSKTFDNLLDFGSYTVKEVTLPTDWDLTSIGTRHQQ
jgi:hypothetical protein